MIRSIIALFDRNPHPTEGDVRNAIDGNLCRCGSFPNIVKATLRTSEKMGEMERGK
jgi:aerobic-type carbon monoxide dehydrogenase small subunit (CoxS/CutS family)